MIEISWNDYLFSQNTHEKKFNCKNSVSLVISGAQYWNYSLEWDKF